LSDAVGRDAHRFAPRAVMRPAAGALGVLVAAALLGCGSDGSSRTVTTAAPGSSSGSARTATGAAPRRPPPAASARHSATSTSSNCAGGVCSARVNCDGTVYTRRGPGPVSTRSSSIDGKTEVTLDFAGRASDTIVRC
jgi:hypothetical protein